LQNTKLKHFNIKSLKQSVVAAQLLLAATYGKTNFSTTKEKQHMEAEEITETLLKKVETGWNMAKWNHLCPSF